MNRPAGLGGPSGWTRGPSGRVRGSVQPVPGTAPPRENRLSALAVPPKMIGVDDSATLLAAYDDQLRTDAEIPGASAVTRLGPLRPATYAGGRGFVTLSLIHI